MKSMPLTPTRPNSSVTARASAPAVFHERDVLFSKDVPAVLVSRRSERLFADELPRDAEQYRPSAGRHEHDRTRRPVDELLQIAAARQLFAGLPPANSLAAAGGERFHEPCRCRFDVGSGLRTWVTVSRTWARQGLAFEALRRGAEDRAPAGSPPAGFPTARGPRRAR